MTSAEQRQKETIAANNAYVLALFRAGENLATIPSRATHFPPRPIIKKNKDALEFFPKARKLHEVTDLT